MASENPTDPAGTQEQGSAPNPPEQFSREQVSREQTSMDKEYRPENIEKAWYSRWLELGLFAPREASNGASPYVIVIPPPNITGNLHLGHALDNTLQDILIRWRRMQGFETLWLPGIDHAGIATQMVVERALRERGTTRHDIGRERFLEEVWSWKERHAG